MGTFFSKVCRSGMPAKAASARSASDIPGISRKFVLNDNLYATA